MTREVATSGAVAARMHGATAGATAGLTRRHPVGWGNPRCRRGTVAGHPDGRWPVMGRAAVRRAGELAAWAPSGRTAVPLIVLLVVVANLVGVATVTVLLLGVSGGAGGDGRAAVLWTAAGYTLLALPVG